MDLGKATSHLAIQQVVLRLGLEEETKAAQALGK